jgi:2-polyprenyl-6-methoxyphenol hydroxylase-like FAD-dependent oxidoreductase
LGVEVERQTELPGFKDATTRVLARLKKMDGEPQVCEAVYIAGCDGVHSTVREGLEIGFPSGVYNHLFYVAGVEASGATSNGEVHVGLDATDFLALFPLKCEGRRGSSALCATKPSTSARSSRGTTSASAWSNG